MTSRSFLVLSLSSITRGYQLKCPFEGWTNYNVLSRDNGRSYRGSGRAFDAKLKIKAHNKELFPFSFLLVDILDAAAIMVCLCFACSSDGKKTQVHKSQKRDIHTECPECLCY